jgi:hypothetical protein
MAAVAYKMEQEDTGLVEVVEMLACDEMRLHAVHLACAPVLLASDVEHLWQLTFEEPVISRDVIEALFVIEAHVPVKEPQWAFFFTETVAHYAIWDVRPTGVVSGSMAEWLVEQVDRAGTKLALGVLAHIIAEAPYVPSWLPAVVSARLAALTSAEGQVEKA